MHWRAEQIGRTKDQQDPRAGGLRSYIMLCLTCMGLLLCGAWVGRGMTWARPTQSGPIPAAESPSPDGSIASKLAAVSSALNSIDRRLRTLETAGEAGRLRAVTGVGWAFDAPGAQR